MSPETREGEDATASPARRVARAASATAERRDVKDDQDHRDHPDRAPEAAAKLDQSDRWVREVTARDRDHTAEPSD